MDEVNQLSRLFVKLKFGLEFEFPAVCTNTDWDSSLSNSSSKNSLLN